MIGARAISRLGALLDPGVAVYVIIALLLAGAFVAGAGALWYVAAAYGLVVAAADHFRGADP